MIITNSSFYNNIILVWVRCCLPLGIILWYVSSTVNFFANQSIWLLKIFAWACMGLGILLISWYIGLITYALPHHSWANVVLVGHCLFRLCFMYKIDRILKSQVSARMLRSSFVALSQRSIVSEIPRKQAKGKILKYRIYISLVIVIGQSLCSDMAVVIHFTLIIKTHLCISSKGDNWMNDYSLLYYVNVNT
jgi:hypothetical protein